jgi:hypothetical protein
LLRGNRSVADCHGDCPPGLSPHHSDLDLVVKGEAVSEVGIPATALFGSGE